MDSQKILASLPHKPWVYLFKNKKDEILYIGKAKNLKKRVAQYFNPNSVWKQDMLNKAHTVDFFTVKTESEALYLEDNLIKTHQPPFNSILKGANSYSYIKLTNEPIPKVFITRKRIKDGATYIWPKHNIRALKKLLQYLRQVLQFRTCSQAEFNKRGYCNDYYFWMCAWWGKKRREDPKTTEAEYQKIMKILIKFFKGDTKVIKDTIKEKIQQAIEIENFEWAARLRDVYHSIEDLTERQHVVLSKQYTGVIFLIKKIARWYMVGSINFFEGKIVDILVNKFDCDDVDQEHLVTLFENEFGHFYVSWWEDDKKNDDIVGYQKRQVNKTMLNEAKTLLNNAIESYMIASAWNRENVYNEVLIDLQKKYQLKHFPYHIECIDISHLSGDWISWGLSAMLGGIPNTKYYRRYKITSVEHIGNDSNDYLALKEVITRRFQLDTTNSSNSTPGSSTVSSSDPGVRFWSSAWHPNLFILDWGKGQLNIIKKLYQENRAFQDIFAQVDFVALGKGQARKQSNIGKETPNSKKTPRGLTQQTDTWPRGANTETETIAEHLYFFDDKMHIKSKALDYDHTDSLLITLRNEAHRFANQYRKKQMSKEWKKK